ncbi:Di-copper centre-containing protein [Russula emetica]|nr:Di-copper centre-containing protein [Russula emetica]
MQVIGILSIALAFIWSLVGVSCSYIGPGPCTNPAVRKEWRTFSASQRADWIRAVNCLSHLPHDPSLTPSVDPSVSLIPPVNASGSYYDDIVYMHMDLNTRIHYTGQFLPWHRWYVYVFEQSLKNKCGYTGEFPYWDWTIDAPNFYESSFWKDSDPNSGLGGWGDPNKDFSVPDGGFNNFHISYPSPHTLRRNYKLLAFNSSLLPAVLKPFLPDPLLEANVSFTASAIEALLETPAGDYRDFQKTFEGWEGAHAAVHLTTGGDLGGTCPINAPSNCVEAQTWSANEPLFFMHHAMVDKVWYDWQLRDPANANSFFGGSVEALQSAATYNQYPTGGPPFLGTNSTIPADGMFPEVTIGDVLDTTSGILCYIYE